MSGIYPDRGDLRLRAVSHDALVFLLLIAFAWLGVRVHQDVDRLSALGTGVVDAGNSVRTGFSAAASAVGGIPLAGGPLASGLRDAAGATGGNVVAVGRAGSDSAHHLALVLGLASWAVPSLLLLALVLPRRIHEVRELRQLRRALSAANAEQRRHLLALRAVLTLPEEVLFAYSADPAADLLAGRYERLTAAALESGGIKPPS
jgi:hypothetical protein